MSAISFLGCLIGRHKPVRREVVWDGRIYLGNCRQGAVPIIRRGRATTGANAKSRQPDLHHLKGVTIQIGGDRYRA